MGGMRTGSWRRRSRAGLTKIDYVLITHFHEDHVGGAPQLAARIPIGTFIDHGENRESGDAPTVQVWQAYQALLATGKYKRITPKPGDVLPIQGMRVEVISADGALIAKPLPGAGQENAACKESETRPADKTENLRSLGDVDHFREAADFGFGRSDMGQGNGIDVPGE